MHHEVYAKSPIQKDPSPLKVKEVWVHEQDEESGERAARRCVVCLTARQLALKYKQLWMVEAMLRAMKSLLETRPIYHKCDETIRGHVFCSFLALVLRKELLDRIEAKGWHAEWGDIIRDLDNLIEIEIRVEAKGYIVRSEAKGATGKAAQAAGVALPPVLRPCEAEA